MNDWIANHVPLIIALFVNAIASGLLYALGRAEGRRAERELWVKWTRSEEDMQ